MWEEVSVFDRSQVTSTYVRQEEDMNSLDEVKRVFDLVTQLLRLRGRIRSPGSPRDADLVFEYSSPQMNVQAFVQSFKLETSYEGIWLLLPQRVLVHISLRGEPGTVLYLKCEVKGYEKSFEWLIPPRSSTEFSRFENKLVEEIALEVFER